MSLFVPRKFHRSRTCLPMLAAIAEAVEMLEAPAGVEATDWQLKQAVQYQADIHAKKRACPRTDCRYWAKCTHRPVQLTLF